jgi:hypothetical protein|tara:strand:+ start:109 stop:246 length:138 start_codon:yes stop_codon:yes gene_type:complete
MISAEELQKEMEKFYQWADALARQEVTPEEEEEWRRLEKQSNMSK